MDEEEQSIELAVALQILEQKTYSHTGENVLQRNHELQHRSCCADLVFHSRDPPKLRRTVRIYSLWLQGSEREAQNSCNFGLHSGATVQVTVTKSMGS